MDKKNTNLDELLKIIAASGAGIPIAGIRVMAKKADEEPVGKEAADKETVGKKHVNYKTADKMDEPADPTKNRPSSICIENLHIHMDERMTTNYGPGALEGVSDEDCECGEDAEEACDSGSNKSCNRSDDGIDFDQMVRFIRRRTGMCERTVLAFLAAQIEYLDSVIDEEDEV